MTLTYDINATNDVNATSTTRDNSPKRPFILYSALLGEFRTYRCFKQQIRCCWKYQEHCATYGDVVGSHLAVNRIRPICAQYKSNEVSSGCIIAGRAGSEQSATKSQVLVAAVHVHTGDREVESRTNDDLMHVVYVCQCRGYEAFHMSASRPYH